MLVAIRRTMARPSPQPQGIFRDNKRSEDMLSLIGRNAGAILHLQERLASITAATDRDPASRGGVGQRIVDQVPSSSSISSSVPRNPLRCQFEAEISVPGDRFRQPELTRTDKGCKINDTLSQPAAGSARASANNWRTRWAGRAVGCRRMPQPLTFVGNALVDG